MPSVHRDMFYDVACSSQHVLDYLSETHLCRYNIIMLNTLQGASLYPFSTVPLSNPNSMDRRAAQASNGKRDAINNVVHC